MGSWPAGRVSRRLAMLALGAGLAPWTYAASNDAARGVAVVYPDLGEPYRRVFETIIEGIEQGARTKVQRLPVPASASASAASSDLAAELRRREVRTVISLGRQGLRAASGLDRSVGVVAGGLLSLSEAEAQHLTLQSLAPDPALLFARLKVLAPAARRVHVVFDPRQNNWLIRLARDAARQQGLELVALEAEDLQSAVRSYTALLGSMDARQDVLWLPQDSTTVDDATVIPLLLREAWRRNLLLFSSNVAHVRRGVLFALYPDNMGLGRTLAAWATAHAASGAESPRGVHPLRDVLLAVNTRTAQHLGIPLNRTSLRFNTVFPEP